MKRLSALLIAIAALFLAPMASHAAVHTAGTVLHTENEGGDGEGNDGSESHQEDGQENESGSNESSANEKDESFVVPPVAINPQLKRSGIHPIPGSPTQKLTPRVPGEHDKTSGKPIDIGAARPEAKTPVQKFVDTATIGLGAIGAGAFTLGGAVLVRTIRNRRKGEKFDYFYGD